MYSFLNVERGAARAISGRIKHTIRAKIENILIMVIIAHMSDTHKDASLEEGYLTGKLLLAMPAMGDPRFRRSVIYMCSHDANGAMGLVINHAITEMGFSEILKELPIESEIEIDPSALKVPVMLGGPVDAGRGFLLHSNDFSDDQTIIVDGSFSMTATLDALRAVASGGGPAEKLFILGYAGWSAGQLDEEIQNNSWLVTEPDADLIFKVDHDDKWEKAVSGLGFDPAMLVSDAGRA